MQDAITPWDKADTMITYFRRKNYWLIPISILRILIYPRICSLNAIVERQCLMQTMIITSSWILSSGNESKKRVFTAYKVVHSCLLVIKKLCTLRYKAAKHQKPELRSQIFWIWRVTHFYWPCRLCWSAVRTGSFPFPPIRIHNVPNPCPPLKRHSVENH